MKDQVESDGRIVNTSAWMPSELQVNGASVPKRSPCKISLTLLFIFWENWRTKMRKPWNLLKWLLKSSVSPSPQGEGRKYDTWHRKWGHLFMNSMWDFLWEGYSVTRKPALVPPTQNLSNNSSCISSWTGCCFICRGGWSLVKGGLAWSRGHLG